MGSYAVFSDVHGNIDALTAVWNSVHNLGLSNRPVLNAGDTVAHGPDSSACIDFLLAHDEIETVGGNYDYNVAMYPEEAEKFEHKWGKSRPDKLQYIRSASEQITDPQRAWLKTLPKLTVLEWEGLQVALCHYSPIGKKIGLGNWTTEDNLYEIATAAGYDVIVTGHTHSAFVRRANQTLFVNPGTVGLSWSHPTFAIITISNGIAEAEVRP